MLRRYLDSNIVIYLVERRDELRQQLVSRLGISADKDKPLLCSSELVRLECRVGPIKRGDAALLDQYDHFFANPRAELLSIDKAVFERATKLRAEHGLKTPDALHLAIALSGNCDEFWTNDQRLLRAAKDQINIVTPENS